MQKLHPFGACPVAFAGVFAVGGKGREGDEMSAFCQGIVSEGSDKRLFLKESAMHYASFFGLYSYTYEDVKCANVEP